jgi:hypothetical protein
MRRSLRDQRGGVMIITAVAFLTLLLFAGMALDFGRAYLLKAQLQTAIDASSLAGALQVVPMWEIERSRWELIEETCTDPTTKEPYTCSHWERVSPARYSGPEREIRRNWERLTADQCSSPYRCDRPYRVVREWLVMPASTEPTARSAFAKNEAWPTGALGVTVEGVSVSVDRAKAEVTTTAVIRVPTTFLKLIGIRELRFTRKGSAVPVRR